MDFIFSWDERSAFFAALATLVFLFIVGIRFFTLIEREQNARKRMKNSHESERAVKAYRGFSRRKFVLVWLIIWVVAYGIGALISFWVSSSSQPDREATLYDAIEEYGLSNETTYPLYLGGTQNSLTGTAQVHAGIFSSSAVIDLKPTTVVNIGFEHNELWWPLALPADKSPFKETDGEPSVEIWFQDQTLGFGEAALRVYDDENAPERAYYEAYWDVKWSECKMEFRNFVLTCTRVVESEKLIVSDEWSNQSIPEFFERYFDHAQINLSSEQHDVLFPKN